VDQPANFCWFTKLPGFGHGVCLLLLGAITAFAANDAIEVPLLDDGVGFRIPIQTLGRTLYFLVDTGASRTEFDVTYLSRLGPPKAGTSAFH
jgi:hypothetical protein